MSAKRKRKHSDEKENAANDDEIVANPKKRRPQFELDDFLKSLQNAKCFSALKKLVQFSKGGPEDWSVQFLQADGKFEDIFKVLDSGQNLEMQQIFLVLNALHTIILRCVTEVPGKLKIAHEAGYKLLGPYLKFIQQLLKFESEVVHKKMAVRVLTALVTLGPELAQEVLNQVKLDTTFIQYIIRPGKVYDKLSARTCFIHFVMAFLMEGKETMISSILGKKAFLKYIAPGFKYDPAQLVVLVLSTLRTKVVENTSVRKAQKLHIFNSFVLKHLFSLYYWEGPGSTSKDKGLGWAHTEQRQDVAEAVHQLLLVLCTSHRFGIVFASQSPDAKHNELLASMLLPAQALWEHPLQAALVVRILAACPALGPHLLRSVAPALRPRASAQWQQTVQFVTEVLCALGSEYLLRQGAGVLRELVPAGLRHSHAVVRTATAQLLCTVLRATDMVPASAKLHQVLPDGATLQSACEAALGMGADEEAEEDLQTDTLPAPPPAQQLLAVLDLLVLYSQRCPLLLPTAPVGDGPALGDSLAPVLGWSAADGIIEAGALLRLQIRTVEVLMLTDGPRLIADTEQLSAAVRLLLQAGCGPDAQLAESAHCVLVAVAQACGPLAEVSTPQELDVWLHCLRGCAPGPGGRTQATDLMVEALLGVVRNTQHWSRVVAQAQAESRSAPVELISADQFFQELVRPASEASVAAGCPLPDQWGWPSLLLASALKAASRSRSPLPAPLEQFLACALVHLLHMQVEPGPFLRLALAWPAAPPALARYLRSWADPAQPPAPLAAAFGHCGLESMLSRLLLEPGRPALELEGCLEPGTAMLLARLVTFHLAQLGQRGVLSAEVCTAAQDALQALLPSTDAQCQQGVLSHPLLLRLFAPLTSCKHVAKRLVTGLLLELAATAPPDALAPLRAALARTVARGLRRDKPVPAERSEALLQSVEVLRLGPGEALALVRQLVEESAAALAFGPWPALLGALLPRLSAPPPGAVVQLSVALTQLCTRYPKVAERPLEGLAQLLESQPLTATHLSTELFQWAVRVAGAGHAPAGARVACSLLQLRAPLVRQLGPLLSAGGADAALAFPLLAAAASHGPLPMPLLRRVYRQHRAALCRALLAPPAAPPGLAEQPALTHTLVQCMEATAVQEACLMLSLQWQQLKPFSTFHTAAVGGLLARGGWAQDSRELLKLLLRQLLLMLQAQSQQPASKCLAQLCVLITEFAQRNRRKIRKALKREGSENGADWAQLPRRVLQTALAAKDCPAGPQLLDTLCLLLRLGKDRSTAEQVFGMAAAHSQFLALLATADKPTLKLSLLSLLLQCCQLQPTLVKDSHVPVWLGAYGASLAPADQVILKLLHLYEASGVSLHQFQPLLWGRPAVEHYSVREFTARSLWHAPQAATVLSLLKPERVQATVARFPIQRSLLQDAGSTAVDEACTDPEVYDPAFILPLLCHVAAPECALRTHQFYSCGALTIVLAAQASECESVRAAAATVIARYHAQVQISGERGGNQYVLHLHEGLRAGLRELAGPGTEPTEVPRVPGPAAAFMARLVDALLFPKHPLFRALNQQFLTWPVPNLRSVPHLHMLLHHHSMQFRKCQQWLLEGVRNGLRTKEDVLVAQNCHLFKILMGMFFSSMANRDVQALILEVLVAAAHVREGAAVLLQHHGALPWLRGLLRQLTDQPEADRLTGPALRLVAALGAPAASLLMPALSLPVAAQGAELTSEEVRSLLRLAVRTATLLAPAQVAALLQLSMRLVSREDLRYCRNMLQLQGVCVSEVESSQTVALDTDGQVETGRLLCKFVSVWIEIHANDSSVETPVISSNV